MKTNKETLQAAMDRRLSFLDDLPSCRTALKYRIAQEEEPVMKKKVSLGFVFAMVLVLLSVAALATSLLLSPRADAARIADQALEKQYGITAEMHSYLFRQQDNLPDGAIEVTYTGVGSMEYVLGTYTAVVRDGKAEISWSHDGENTAGGYEAEAWGSEQLKQMIMDSQQEDLKQAYMDKAWAIGEEHGAFTDDDTPSEAVEDYYKQIEADKTAALEARKVSEEDMIATGREFIVSNYGLNEEQVARLELYTNTVGEEENSWYDMVNGVPCFQVEYLLYAPYTTEQLENNEPLSRTEMDGYYVVYVNVETGAIENYEYNSGLAGVG